MSNSSASVLLRDFRLDDLAAIWAYECRPETHRYESEVPLLEVVKERLEKNLAGAREDPRTRYQMAITLPPEDLARGTLALTLKNSEIDEWEIGWVVHSDFWGQGIASQAARQMLGFAFGQLRAHRVVAFCNVNNSASIRVMEKIGMQREGRLRQTRWWQGGWCDEFVYASLRL